MNKQTFEQAIVGEIPKAAAASFFVKLKSSSLDQEDKALAMGVKLASKEDVAEAKKAEPKGIPGGEVVGEHMKDKLGADETAKANLKTRLRQRLARMTPRQRQEFAGAMGIARGVVAKRRERRPGLAGPAVTGGGAGMGIGALAGLLAKRPGIGTAIGGALGAATGLGIGARRKGKYKKETRRMAQEAGEKTVRATRRTSKTGLPSEIFVSRKGKSPMYAGSVHPDYGKIRRRIHAAGLQRGARSGYQAGLVRGRKQGVGAASRYYTQKKKAASVQERFMEALRKMAEGEIPAATMAQPESPQSPGAGEYLAAEQAGQAAQEQNEVGFLRQRLQEANANLQQMQETATGLQEQTDQLNAQVQQSTSAVQAAEQSGQIASKAALQNVQMANQQTTQALQQAMDAEGRMTGVRQGLMSVLTQAAAQPQGPMAGLNQAGQPIPDEGVGGEPSQMGGGGGAPPAQAASDSAPVQGEESSTPQAPASPRPGQPQQSPTAERSGGSGQKEDKGRTVNVKVEEGKKESSVKGRLIGGAVGGAAGGGLAAAEGQGMIGDTDALRKSVEEREANRKGGIGGFAQTFNLAKDRALLTLGEYTKESPVAATIGGTLMGAGVGALSGPSIAKGIKGTPGAFKNVQEKARKALG